MIVIAARPEAADRLDDVYVRRSDELLAPRPSLADKKAGREARALPEKLGARPG